MHLVEFLILGENLSFIKKFNFLTVVEYFLSGIFFVLSGIYGLFEGYPKAVNEIPIVYMLLILLEESVFLILFIMGFFIYYQYKTNTDFFQYDQIGSNYKLFKGKSQIILLATLYIFNVIFHFIVQFIFDNFLTSPYYASGMSQDYRETYFIIILIVMLLYLVPYLLLLFYNVVITKYQGLIDKAHMDIPFKTLTIISNILIFIIIVILTALFMVRVELSYFFLWD